MATSLKATWIVVRDVTAVGGIERCILEMRWVPAQEFSPASVACFSVPAKSFGRAAAAFVAPKSFPGRSVGSTIVPGRTAAAVKFQDVRLGKRRVP